MKLHFDPNQSYQLEAIQAVVDLFEGQTLRQGDFEFSLKNQDGFLNIMGVANRLELTEEQILTNLQVVQKRNELTVSEKLDGMHFSVEMETGTGKTYVYLRTIYELSKVYGFRKFVIVVPSIAIREGVLKNLEITNEHFQTLYNNVSINYEVYDAGKVSRLRNFAASNAIQILVINIDSFAKDLNVINRPNDKLTGQQPIEFIRCTHPIVIVDEPQNMETDIRRKALENLNYLCTLRYSATHIRRYNMVYSLNPVKAYDLGLVKQIEVDSIVTKNDFNLPYISVESVSATSNRTSAKVKIDINTKDGVMRKVVSVRVGDDLYELSGNRELYKDGYIVNGIDVANGFISLSNGEDLYIGDSIGGFKDEIMKVQIEKTVHEHFAKEKNLREKGIKVLSLFFIDRVSNYRGYDDNGVTIQGKFAQYFEEAFQSIASKSAYKEVIPFSVKAVHNGYFSQDKNGRWKDSSGETKADDDTFHLIMKDKERLLDINEPLSFIFSHSALREGWDNPNVFQICTLNETHSELKKRQEIGRGMRLPVNQEGVRIFDKTINRLTVIANESYEDFAKQLQTEIESDCGVTFTKDRIKNRSDRVEVKYRKGFELSERFKEIWDKIKYHTKYHVDYKTPELIQRASIAINNMPEIKRPIILTTKASIEMSREGVAGEVKASYGKVLECDFPIPDIPTYIQERTGLTRLTIIEVICQSGRTQDILTNPQYFLDGAVLEIKNVLNQLMIDGIQYEKIGDYFYQMELFKGFEIHRNDYTFDVDNPLKTIYENLIPLDSGVEHDFANECEIRTDIEFYFKLPNWFTIKTPIGEYNPDWALVKKNEETIYFVAETKSKDQELRPSEEQKICCGKEHFRKFEGIRYRKVSCLADLD